MDFATANGARYIQNRRLETLSLGRKDLSAYDTLDFEELSQSSFVGTDGDGIPAMRSDSKIAAGNVPNLVDPTTGGWGKVLLDPINSSMTTTMANLDTLGSLITASLHGGQ